MKKLLVNYFLLLAAFLPVALQGQEIHVSLSGNDQHAGSKEQPVASIHMALRKAREWRRLKDPAIEKGIKIIVAQGRYQLDEPLIVRPEDAGMATSPTFIEAASGASPVISGGILLKGWQKISGKINGLPSSAKGKIWVTDVPVMDFRQLWVNGSKAVRARDRNADSMWRILSWDHQTQTCEIPVSPGNFSFTEGMEMVIHQWWAIAVLRISKTVIEGNVATLHFKQPESRVQSEHPWPAPWISKETGNSAFFLTNAIQFLDQPGEWYVDKKQRKLYYYPRSNENMNEAEVIAPVLETLVKMEGTPDHPVSYVYFKGISFQHTGWLRPSHQGHVPHQAGMYMLDAYKLKIPGTPDKSSLENQAWVGRPAAAVEASYTNHTGFENCRFEHLASTGLDYKRGTHDDLINGNLFKDVGGSAILAGTFSDEAVEVHLPYNPSDEREVCSNLQISNNLITDVANEDWGCVGIGAGYVRGINIHHNEICEVSYSGISLGWGWTKSVNAMRNNKVQANKIHHYAKYMYDVAAVYTLSAQPGTLISENYIDSIYVAPYAHIPSHWFYLYTDEGSSYMTVKDNWCPGEKFLRNANGPGNTWQNNGPQVADSIKKAAGLQPAYAHLLKEKIITPQWPINSFTGTVAMSNEKPVVIEVVMKDANDDNKAKLAGLLKKYAVKSDTVYQWSSHFAFFAEKKNAAKLQAEIKQTLSNTSTHVFDNLFYEFNRTHCVNATVAANWDHIFLTADLVDDPALQKEYMDLHATQFEKWPEVSRGFCNASFQQLLLYRHGRQLMLVISIPLGESLDRLNPKTTENNPRVREWNELMKKYQQGIAGTRNNETWVFLKPISLNKQD